MEAIMQITLNFDLLKKWWPVLAPAGVVFWHKVAPTLANFSHNHPNVTIWIGAGAMFVMALFKSPLFQSASDPAGLPQNSLQGAISKAQSQKG
jgi:hypothetical protein